MAHHLVVRNHRIAVCCIYKSETLTDRAAACGRCPLDSTGLQAPRPHPPHHRPIPTAPRAVRSAVTGVEKSDSSHVVCAPERIVVKAGSVFTLQLARSFQQPACPAGLATTRRAVRCGRQKREDPIVSPRPGLLVCRKEGLSGEIASEVPWWRIVFARVFSQPVSSDRRSAVQHVGFVTRSKS